MLITIVKWFTQLFSDQYQTELDRYISAHNPTTAVDVEYLERQYSKAQRGGLL